jgi:hypothetical protein
MSQEVIECMTYATVVACEVVIVLLTENESTTFRFILLRVATEWATEIIKVRLFLDEPL